MKRYHSLLISLFLFSGFSCAIAITQSTTPPRKGPDGDAFYFPPASATPGKHGRLYWAREISTDVPNAKAWKILYWSTTVDNQVVPVSGLVIAPSTSTSIARPVVTWGHGTSGVPRRCAPSLVSNPARDASFYYLPNSDSEIDYGIPALTDMIAAGYVVVATDYNGLGAPGIHQYLIGQTEARNMLDAALAVQQMPETGAGKESIAIGWSQGGQASVWAAQIADYMGKQGKLLGAVSLAPVNALEEIKIMEKMVASGQPLRPVSGAERMMGWYAMTAAYPELKLSDVLTPGGIAFFNEASKTQCNHQLGDTLAYYEKYTGPAVRSNPDHQDAWMKHYVENSLGNIPAQVPIALYQGEEDLAVFPEATMAYGEKACGTGAVISSVFYKGVDHIRLSAAASSDFLKWIADRFAGKPAPSSCKKAATTT